MRAEQNIGLDKLSWLVAGVALAGLPHWPRLPIWIPILQIILIFARLYFPWRYSTQWRQKQALISLTRIGIMIGGIIGIYLSYRTLTGRDVGIALLVLLAGLKLFESRNSRDFYISAYLGYFLVITNFFYSQTIPTASYMLLVVITMTASLVYFNDTDESYSISKRLRYSASLILQALPILLVLFFLFPRINGPLWGLPEDAHTGVTGIDDQMTPGTISKLVQSNKVAFRVTFDGDIPDPSKLYWRGPVLWQTDGRKWTVGQANTTRRPSPVKLNGKPTVYQMTIEPTNKRWLFGLEMIADPPEETYLTHDQQLKASKPIRERKAFTLSSYNDFWLGKKKEDNFERALNLPEYSHLATKSLAQELREQYQQDSEIVDAALNWFRNENFIYTLKPPLIAGDTVDGFLFDTRQGFCEHYAAAFTVLMRAAGIPARVVTGYQGGEINPLGNYLIVRQYHAHAWTEVWLDDQGWTRIDPTSAVSPDRVEAGIEDVIPDVVIDVPLNLDQNKVAVALWQRLRNSIDMINYQWSQWVLGYGPKRQQRLLEILGFTSVNWQQLGLSLILFIGIIIAVIAFYIFKKTPRLSDPARVNYDIFCKKMARIGLPKLAHEGPLDYAKRINKTRQDIREEITTIIDLYISTRYCSNTEKLPELTKTIKQFAPTKHNAGNHQVQHG